MNKIIIVGGGSAGWMTASTLIKAYPEKDITVIESPNIPTVGVGESTVSGIKQWTKFLGIDDKDFLSYTNGIYKLSIKFTDFYKKGECFHYPFGNPSTDHPLDWWRKKIAKPETPYKNYAECMYSNMSLINSNKLDYDKNRSLPGWNFDFHTAYQFDAIKFAGWLREKYCLPRGVKHIKEEINSVEQDEDGIASLNGKYEADLYIDCTGFKSLLLGDSLNEPFDSLENILPNNSAWATKIPYKDKESEMLPYTNCTAIENGWVWNIPLWDRIGSGYVYSDKFTTDDDALEQFKTHLEKNGVGNLEGLEFRKMDMRTGIHKRLWVKNVVAIGLSGAFIEPLESNGLWTTHEYLMTLVQSLRRGSVSQWDKDNYTFHCKTIYRTFVEFIALHYSLSQRTDTEYWKSNFNKTWCESLLNYDVEWVSGMKKFAERVNYSENAFDGGAHCIAAGMHYSPTNLHKEMHHYQKTEEEVINEFCGISDKLDKRKDEWDNNVHKFDTFYEFMKNNIYI